MNTWIDDLEQRLVSDGRRVWRQPQALGVLFADGLDAWWIRPDRPEAWDLADAAVASRDPAAIRARLAELDRRRARVIHVLRHWLAEQGWWYALRADGRIDLSKAVMSTSVALGSGALTAAVATEPAVHAALVTVLARQCIGVPDAATVERLIGLPPPVDPQADPPAGQQMMTDVPLGAAIDMVGGCTRMMRLVEQAVDLMESGRDPSDVQADLARRAAARPPSPIRAALMCLAERLPDALASIELTGPALSIACRDGLGSSTIPLRPRELAALVRAHGPRGAGDHLAERHLACDRRRHALITALWREAADRGWKLDSDFYGWHLGRVHREWTVDLGDDLSRRLAEGSVEDEVGRMFAAEPAIGRAVIARLGAEGPLPPAPPAGVLPPVPVAPVLPVATSGDEDLDAFTARILAATRQRDDVTWLSLDPVWWDPVIDRWMDADGWLVAARAAVARHPWHVTAQHLLLAAGDAGARAWWRGILDGEFPHHDMEDEEIEVAWLLRHDHPAMAAQVFRPGMDDDGWQLARARAGDVEAARQLVASWSESEDAMSWKRLSCLAPHLVAAVAEQHCVARWRGWAERRVVETWQWEAPDEHLVAAAGTHGWSEVADALAANPWLPARIFRPMVGDLPPTGFGRLLAAWSRLRPAPQVAELVRRGHAQLPGIWGQAVAAARGMNPGRQDSSWEADTSAYWMRDAELGLAIAWHRCRQAGA